MTWTHLVIAIAVWAAGDAAAAQDRPFPDAERHAWRHRRAVEVPATDGFVQLAVTPELVAGSRRDLRDLRLVGEDGQEVPYLIDRLVDRGWGSVHLGRLVSRRSTPDDAPEEERSRNEWVLDFGEVRRFNALRLDVAASDFAKEVMTETSLDGEVWQSWIGATSIFGGSFGGGVRHTEIDGGEPVVARYVRLTMLDHRLSPPVDLAAVSAELTWIGEGREWSREVALRPLEVAATGPARYELAIEDGVWFDLLTLEADEPGFSRSVRLIEIDESRAGEPERTLAEGTAYRLELRDKALSMTSPPVLLTEARERGRLVLELGGATPLRNPRLRVGGAVRRLVFPARPVTLYYGNAATRAPLYDLDAAALGFRLRASLDLPSAMPGPAVDNPLFEAPEPFPFVPAVGAELEVSRWRAVRRVDIEGGPDVFALSLAPEDVALLRGDLADVRLTDDESRQVPFILEPRGTQERHPLDLDARENTEEGWTRYRLTATGLAGEAVALPVDALELHVAQPFFDRPARVLVTSEGRGGDRAVWTGSIRRLPEELDAPAADSAPVRVPLPGGRVEELVLEVDDGDNTPLAIGRVEAVVTVPRVVFKATPGRYRLWLSNAEAEAPRYDLAALRREVLAYSALPLTAGRVAVNPEYRSTVGGYLHSAPPTLIMWSVLIVGVVAMLWLVARAVRESVPPRDDGMG